ICLAPNDCTPIFAALQTLSSRGPGHRPFTAVTRVRIPLGSQCSAPGLAAAASAIVQNRLRCGFIQFELCAHLLQARSERLNLLLLARELGTKAILLPGDRSR